MENVYFAALYHYQQNDSRANDVSRPEIMRSRDRGLADAYAYIVQFIQYNDSIGQTDYKKIHKMPENFPTLYAPREDKK